METNYNLVRKEITERLATNWKFSEQQLTDLSVFHLLNLLMVLAASFGCLGQFAATIFPLREVLGEDQYSTSRVNFGQSKPWMAAANVPVVN